MCSSPVIDSRHRITSRNKAQLIPDAIFARSSYIKNKMVSCLLDSKYYLYRLLIMADPEIQRLQTGGLGSKRHVKGIQGQRILGTKSVTDGNDCKTSKTLSITNSTGNLAKTLSSHFFGNEIAYIKWTCRKVKFWPCTELYCRPVTRGSVQAHTQYPPLSIFIRSANLKEEG